MSTTGSAVQHHTSEPFSTAAIRALLVRLDLELGCGAHGSTHSLTTDTTTVVKIVQTGGAKALSDEGIAARLRVFTKLSHPRINSPYSLLDAPDTIYLQMKRYQKSLDSVIKVCRKQKESFPPELAFTVVKQATEALAYLHGVSTEGTSVQALVSIVHGNIKPANILVDTTNGFTVVLSDGGLYGCTTSNITSQVPECHLYSAPEVIACGAYSPASDIWSLGAVLYELTLVPDSYQPLVSSLCSDKELSSQLAVRIDEIKDKTMQTVLRALLAAEPDNRITAADLLEELARDTDFAGVAHSLKLRLLEQRIEFLEHRVTILESENSRLRHENNNLISDTRELPLHTSNDLPHDPHMNNTHTQSSKEFALVHSACNQHEDCEVPGRSQLVKAARSNNVEAVRALLEAGVQTGVTDESGCTALMAAAKAQSIKAIKLLIDLEHGITDADGRTALMHAAIDGRSTVIGALCQYERGMQDNEGKTALMHAVIHGHRRLVTMLVNEESKIQDANGWTALMHAATRNNASMVSALALKEAQMKDHSGDTALLHALRLGLHSVCKILLPLELPTDSDGYTALMRAADSSDTEMVRLIAPLQAGMQLMSARTDPPYCNAAFRTALMGAAANGMAEAVHILQEQEARIQDANGWTALMFAAAFGHMCVVTILAQDECNMMTYRGKTVEQIAAEAGHYDIASFLQSLKQLRL